MDIKISVQRTEEMATTKTIVVGPGIEVCRVRVVRQSEDGEETSTVSEHVRHTQKSEDPYFGQFSVVDPSLLEKLRMTGWFRDDKDYGLISQEPFTLIKSGKPFEVVRLKNYDHTLYTMDGQRLPVALGFTYIEGRVNDHSFDLLKLLEHLQMRKDVTLHADRSLGAGHHHGQWISAVPYYNRGGMSGQYHLAFTWHPDVETFRKFVASIKGRDSWDRYAAAHTIMGNDEFRIPERAEPEADDE